jgi:hypothetical protein
MGKHSTHKKEGANKSESAKSSVQFNSDASAHDSFFASIISMIPRELYKPVEEEEEDTNVKYHKHKKQPLPADVKKNIRSKKIAEKYGQAAPTKEGDDDDNDDVEGSGSEEDPSASPAIVPIMQGGKRFTDDSLETLRERLQARISTLQQTRMSKKRPFEPSNDPQARAEKQQKRTAIQGQGLHSGNKVKGTDPHAGRQAPQGSAFGVANTAAVASRGDGTESMTTSDSVTNQQVALEGNLAAEADIDYSTFSGERGAAAGKIAANKGKPGTRKQRLERMLETADNRRARLEQLRNSGADGAARLKEELWNDVLGSAQGRDGVDANKVKKALKRREKDKQKSAKEWSARLKAVEQGEKAKIEKREGNIKARKSQTNGVVTEADVKAAAKVGGRNKEKALQANRERRPGFEGKVGGGAKGQGQFLNSKEKKKQMKTSSE